MIDLPKKFTDLAYDLCGQNFGTIITSYDAEHPFDQRNIHPAISRVSKQLFDDGHYKHATLDAFIRIEEEVKKKSSLNDEGGSI